ncbi:MAG TPA: nucleoside-diphosphate sugar epimerase [Planctomycetaceae bacterium]|nr:nucleoside-diphosphate sugar epimerase [Planctomycetaceae bacterium]
MSRKKILITGGAGFVGSHLADYLVKRGSQITILDDLSTGSFANISQLDQNDSVEIIIDTVLNESLVEDLIRSHDYVYHLASAVGVKLIIEQPVKTIETIVGGTEIVLRYASRYRKPVLLTSTSEVYGKGTQIPFREDDDVVTGSTSKHRWAYACSKALDEFLALAHWRGTRLPVAIVRMFNTVGPRQTGKYGMVVPRFVQAAMKNEPITIYGDGNQSRCFGHVHDVTEALVKILETPNCYGKVINVGYDQEITIKDLAETIVSKLGSSSPIEYLSYENAYGDGFEDMQRRVPSIERLQQLTGHEMKRDLNTIIADVHEYFLNLKTL